MSIARATGAVAAMACLALAALPATGSLAAGQAGPGRSAAAGGGPAPCNPSEVSGVLDLGSVGGESTSPAGEMLFRDVAGEACTLEGAPEVTAESSAGAAVPLYELRSVPRHDRAVVLTPGTSGRSGAASVTWSFWGCHPGSYSLEVRFAGWKSPVTLPSSPASGYSGPACTSTDETIYVGAVATGHG